MLRSAWGNHRHLDGAFHIGSADTGRTDDCLFGGADPGPGAGGRDGDIYSTWRGTDDEKDQQSADEIYDVKEQTDA